MTPDAYRAAIAALGLSQVGAAKALGIAERTSRRYALRGVPDRAARRVQTALDQLKECSK